MFSASTPARWTVSTCRGPASTTLTVWAAERSRRSERSERRRTTFSTFVDATTPCSRHSASSDHPSSGRLRPLGLPRESVCPVERARMGRANSPSPFNYFAMPDSGIAIVGRSIAQSMHFALRPPKRSNRLLRDCGIGKCSLITGEDTVAGDTHAFAYPSRCGRRENR